jgi:oligoendopeptidase F
MFEKKAHGAIQKGITAEELSEMWMETLKEQFGNSVKVDKIFKYEWCVIPHIVNSPFYCYAYNFGELLSYALFARYKKEGKSFIPKIEKILAAGGSEDPDIILKRVGVDMKSEKFWQGSFEIIRGWQNELEKLG